MGSTNLLNQNIVDGKIVDIKIKEVKGKKSLPHKELKDFKIFVEKFKDEIVQKWVEYFVYHKTIKCIKIDRKV